MDSLSLSLSSKSFHQVTAEVMLATGDIMARSSRPCMLRFRSLPVRLIQTSIMSLPVVMGITGETQEIRVQILKYKEGYPRTEAIKVTLKPKAGSTALPELYAARIFINSQPPWRKELVHNWKWTFYVWSSLYMYIMLLMILVGCCKPIIFPMMSIDDYKLRDQPTQVVKDQPSNLGGDGAISDECSEAIKKWHQSISKRKSLGIRTWVIPEPDLVSSCDSSITRDKTGYGVEEAGETAASESEYESC